MMERVFMRYLFLLLFLLTFFMPTQAQTSLAERGYGVYAPSYLTADSEAMPLVIVLHGYGDTAQNLAPLTGFLPLAEAEGFIVAFPNGYLRQWNDGGQGRHYEDDVAILLELIDLLASNVPIDRERIYLVGFSNGGTMVYRAHCEQPEVFAGIAAISGTMRMDQPCPARAYTNVAIIHGTGDETVPFLGSAPNRRHGVIETSRIWSRRNECTDDLPDFEYPFSTRTAQQHYQTCAEGTQVLLYAIKDLPHTWAGAIERHYTGGHVEPEIDATRIVWNFFEEAYAAQQALEDGS